MPHVWLLGHLSRRTGQHGHSGEHFTFTCPELIRLLQLLCILTHMFLANKIVHSARLAVVNHRLGKCWAVDVSVTLLLVHVVWVQTEPTETSFEYQSGSFFC